MKRMFSQSQILIRFTRSLVALVCALLILPGDVNVLVPPLASAQDQPAPAKLPPDQLDSLVAPIALYPDPLLSQTLVAATYPLEIIQLQQWLTQHKDLKDKALADAVQKQDWDPSIQAMAAMPDVVKRLADDIKWTTDLGNAFLAQQAEVMDAVQRMRKKAKDTGNLKSTEQQKVEVQTVESKQVIVVQQSNPEVIYVPSYNPTVVYGPPAYPYPPITYPPPGYYAAGIAISFGVGMAMGAAFGGGWGYGCGWGHNDVNVNINNNYQRNTNVNGGNRVNNVQGGNRVNAQGGNSWQHNPQHRGGAPYSDRSTANKYGGTARGDSMSTRQANARQNQGQRGAQGAGVSDRSAGGNRQQAGVSDRSAGGGNAGDRGASAGTRDASSNRGGGGGGDRVGDRSVPSGGSRNSSAFGGSSGSSARASSSRGSSSMGGSRGGGGGRRR